MNGLTSPGQPWAEAPPLSPMLGTASPPKLRKESFAELFCFLSVIQQVCAEALLLPGTTLVKG